VTTQQKQPHNNIHTNAIRGRKESFVAVRIRLKRLGRKHRPFFRICAMDVRTPRDGKVIEELGHYDPMVRETDARAVLKGERIDYWLGVGAKPTDKVQILIKKYGTNGTHLNAQKEALERLKTSRPTAPPPRPIPLPKAKSQAASADDQAQEGQAQEGQAQEGQAQEGQAEQSQPDEAAGNEENK
jgi:small subunit ribosomal protein S16